MSRAVLSCAPVRLIIASPEEHPDSPSPSRRYTIGLARAYHAEDVGPWMRFRGCSAGRGHREGREQAAGGAADAAGRRQQAQTGPARRYAPVGARTQAERSGRGAGGARASVSPAARAAWLASATHLTLSMHGGHGLTSSELQRVFTTRREPAADREGARRARPLPAGRARRSPSGAPLAGW